MMVTRPELGPTELAARVAQNLGRTHGIAYAHIGPDWRIVQASSNLGELFDISDNSLIGQPIYDLFWEFVGAEETLGKVLRGEEPEFTLGRVNRTQDDGDMRYLDFRIVPLESHDTSGGLLLIIEDVTPEGELEQRLVQDRNELRLAQNQLAQANEKLARLNQLKSLFLSMAAHDMRAPLTAILGYAELARYILPADTPEEGQEYLAIITSQIQWLNQMIQDMLDLDRIETGQLMIQPQACDLAAMVREVVEMLMVMAHRKNLSLTLNLPEDPIPMEADPGRIRQVLFNLLSNAVKYTADGGLVEVTAREMDRGVELLVGDNGRGMTEAELSNIFQLYYRTESAQKSREAGTGLGLFIVKTMVDAHGGEIEVFSQPGVGTKFAVSFPKKMPVSKLEG